MEEVKNRNLSVECDLASKISPTLMKYAFLRNLILANSTLAEIIKFSIMGVFGKVDKTEC